MVAAGNDAKGRCFTIISDFRLMCLEELRKTSICTDGVPNRDSKQPHYEYKPETSLPDQGFSSKRLYFRHYINLSLYVGKRLSSILFVLDTHSYHFIKQVYHKINFTIMCLFQMHSQICRNVSLLYCRVTIFISDMPGFNQESVSVFTFTCYVAHYGFIEYCIDIAQQNM